MSRLITLALCSLLFAPVLGTGLLIARASAAGRHEAPQRIRIEWIRKGLMLGHYNAALAIQDAVILGNLEKMRPLATHLADEIAPPRLPTSAAPNVEVMRAAARRTASATTLEGAAEGTAALLATCGSCHRAAGVRPELGVPPPRPVGGVVGHMLEHQQAVELMLEGLVLPSEDSWRNGARGLQKAPLPSGEFPRDQKLSPTVLAAETRLHALGNDAAAATTADARVAAYGRILTTCGTCHGLRPDAWGPGPR